MIRFHLKALFKQPSKCLFMKEIYKCFLIYEKAKIRRYLFLILVFATTLIHAQESVVSGKVTDESGEGIPGVSIVEIGTSNGTITAIDGTYQITVPQNAELAFSFMGYKTVRMPVNGRSVLDVQLTIDILSLQEVVVVGYGEQTKADVTGAITTIDSKDFNAGVIGTPDQLLTGKLTGVQITPSGGAPGNTGNIVVRGISSLSGTADPLYVVDGFPLDGRNVLPGGVAFDPLGQAPVRSPLTSINPNDIENITVLKDASATAIYGARAANGVVLITTKSAKNNSPFFNFSSSVSTSSLRGEYDILSAEEYRALGQEEQVSIIDFGGDVDYVDAIIEDNVISQDHYLSFGNSNEAGDFVLSLGYNDQQGIMKGSRMERITARLNARQNLIGDFLTSTLNLQVTQLNDDIAPVGPSIQASGNLISGVISNNPTTPLYHPGTDSLVQRGHTVNGLAVPEDHNNPLAILDHYTDEARTTRVLGNISLNAQFTEELSGEVRFGVDKSISSRETALSEIYVGRAGSGNLNGIIVGADNQLSSVLFDGLVRYSKGIGSGTLKVLTGYSYQEFSLDNSYFTGTNPDPAVNWIELLGFGANTVTIDAPNSALNGNAPRFTGGNDYRIQSVFGRVNYDISRKYLFTGTLRYDGSSKFGANSQYGWFPSGAFGWVLSEEAFLPETFTNLKLRVGWGITGSQNAPVSASKAIQTFVPSGVDANGNQLFSREVTQQANPDLKWEETRQLNLGLDFQLDVLNLYGSIDYFDKTTEDLVVGAPSRVGVLRFENLDAEIKNTGLEVVLGTNIVGGQSVKDLNVNVSVNYTRYFRSEVTAFGGARPLLSGFVAAPGVQGGGSPTQQISADTRLGQWYIPAYRGYDEEFDVHITDPQQYIDADAIPDYNLGINLSVTYKGFDFAANFTGAGGHQILNVTTNSFLQRNRLGSGYNISESNINKFEGPVTASPPALSSAALEDGDYVRLNNISLGYSFGMSQFSWMNSLRLFVSGQNVALWSDYTGLDPEVNVGSVAAQGVPSYGIDNGAYPVPRTFTFGVQASF